MKNKILALLALVAVAVCFWIPQNSIYAKQSQDFVETSSSARAMCVLEASSGRVLFGKNIDQKLPMASTTKVFTALTVLENCKNLDEKVQVDDRAVGIEGTSIYLRRGEVLTVKELLLGMMLPSGNDAATALAFHIGGDLETFCRMMSVSAQNAGAFSSSFKNPHGLDQTGHFTTAYDLAKVSAKALQNQVFYEISTTKSAVISGNSEVKSRFLKNKNRLLKSFDGANGVKTGFTDNAGRCFVASAKRDNMQLVCTVLNCQDMFEEGARLMDKAFDEYKLTPLVENYNLVQEIAVKNGKSPSVKLFSRENFAYPLTNDEKLKISVKAELPECLVAPVKKEQIVGKLNVYLDGKLLFQDDILTREQIKKNSVWNFVEFLIKKFI